MVKPGQKMETEKILELVAEMRALLPQGIPERYRPAPMPRPADETRMAPVSIGDAEGDFEKRVVVDAIRALSDELNYTLDAIDAKLVEDCLNVYYTMEEMVKDPQHAALIPHLEAMRKAYSDSYGKPIPPRPKKESE